MSCMMATAVSESSPEVGSSSMSTCKHSTVSLQKGYNLTT